MSVTMAAVDYLGEKMLLGDREWLKREPRETHPMIRAAVREAKASGLFYDDDVRQFVADLVGIESHGPLFQQLGHEVYVAKGELKDEEAQAEVEKAHREGYSERQLSKLPDGRYLMRFGTTYCGQTVAVYGKPQEFRVKNAVLYRKRAKNGTCASGWALVKEVSGLAC